MDITAQQIASATGATLERATNFLPFFQDCFPIYRINTSGRVAAFLAQVGHESGGLKWLEEIWGPTEAQVGYEHRADLGNTMPGDGYMYRGRGLIQLTGRANYRRMGNVLQIPFEEHPDMVADPRWATETACQYWFMHKCNELADAGNFEQITRAINGGLNGYADRLALFDKAQDALAVA